MLGCAEEGSGPTDFSLKRVTVAAVYRARPDVSWGFSPSAGLEPRFHMTQ